MNITVEFDGLDDLKKNLTNEYYYEFIATQITDSDLLLELSVDEDPLVREAVAKNVNTSEGTLLKLSDDVPVVYEAVAANISTPKEVLTKLANKKSAHSILVENENTPKEALAIIALNSNNDKIIAAVVNHKNTSEETIVKISKSVKVTNLSFDETSICLKEALADNEKTPKEKLHQLAFDKNSEVRKKVATNKKTSPETLAKLAFDDDSGVISYAVDNPKTPTSVLKIIINSNYINDGIKNYTRKNLEKRTHNKK